jgi:hypothetical protein
MTIKEHIRGVRASLKELFSHSIYEAAQFNGLAIEYPSGMPANYDGHLDTHDTPRFIAVNPDLPQREQVYIIAREIGRLAQLRGQPSIFTDSSWKRNLLATAPTETKDLINRLDVEVRAYWIMLFHADNATRSEFRERHPKSYWLAVFPTPVSDFIFWRLRISTILSGSLSTLRLTDNKPVNL